LFWWQCANVKERALAILADAPSGFAREVGVGEVGEEFFNERKGVPFEFFHVPVRVVVLTTEGFKGFGRGGPA